LKHRLKQAIDAINDDEFSFASVTARVFNVSVRTLQKRLAETYISLFDRELHEYKLNTKQKEAIIVYLTRLNKLLISARLRHLREAINFLLSQINLVNSFQVK